MRCTWNWMVAAALALAAAACGDETAKVEPGTKATAGLPDTVLASAEPVGAQEIAAAKAVAKEGDEIVVRGVVGGSAKPIVAGRAVFTLADPKALKACNTREGDTCATPWDFCCETPEDMSANTLTVQFVGADGRPLAADVEASGVKPLVPVVVKGTVGPRPDPKVLVIDATSIWVEGARAGGDSYNK